MKTKKHLCSFCSRRFYTVKLRFQHANECKEIRAKQ